jgi:hypothetical protein
MRSYEPGQLGVWLTGRWLRYCLVGDLISYRISYFSSLLDIDTGYDVHTGQRNSQGEF